MIKFDGISDAYDIKCTASAPTVYPVTVKPIATPTITGSISVSLSKNPTGTYSTESGISAYVWAIPGGGGNITNGQGSNSITITWSLKGNDKLTVYYQVPSTGCISNITTKIIKVQKAMEVDPHL